MSRRPRCAVYVPVGPSADGSNYDWAIVSGGPPRTNTGAGCAAGPLNPTIFDVNGAGRSYHRVASAKATAAALLAKLHCLCDGMYCVFVLLSSASLGGLLPAGKVLTLTWALQVLQSACLSMPVDVMH
jgi:hypothetical protein